jgi:acyl-CoA thioester hydrolase
MYRQIETYRGFVYPSVIDHVGHMNVHSYTARFDEATWQFLARLGLTPSFLKENRRGAVAVDQHTQYKREVLAGALLHVTSELIALGRTSVRFMHHMFDSETGDEVATTEFVGVYFDTDHRVPAALPAQVHRRAAEMRIESGASMAEVGRSTEEMLALP